MTNLWPQEVIRPDACRSVEDDVPGSCFSSTVVSEQSSAETPLGTSIDERDESIEYGSDRPRLGVWVVFSGDDEGYATTQHCLSSVPRSSSAQWTSSRPEIPLSAIRSATDEISCRVGGREAF